MNDQYQPLAVEAGAPLPVRPTFEERLHDGLAAIRGFQPGDRIIVSPDSTSLVLLHGKRGTVVEIDDTRDYSVVVAMDGKSGTLGFLPLDLALDLTTEGAAVLADPVGALTVEPGARVRNGAGR